MDDLISRQAAIDAIRAFYDEYIVYDNGKSIEDLISELPSAQPEIIRCKDCRWYKKERGWNGIEYTVCKLSTINRPIRKEDDFCSRAERRTDEGD